MQWQNQYWFQVVSSSNRRSQWPRRLRRRFTAACLLRLWVRIPPGAWMFVYRECCVLSGRGLCDELITRTEESYQVWCLSLISKTQQWEGLGPLGGCWSWKKKSVHRNIEKTLRRHVVKHPMAEPRLLGARRRVSLGAWRQVSHVARREIVSLKQSKTCVEFPFIASTIETLLTVKIYIFYWKHSFCHPRTSEDIGGDI